MEASGRIFHRLAHKYSDLVIPQSQIQTLKGGNKGHHLSVTCLAIAQPTSKILSSYNIKSVIPVIYIFSASKDASIIKWDFWTGKRLHTIPGGLKQTKRVRQTIGLKNLKAHIGHTQDILTMDVSSDGKYLVIQFKTEFQ